MLSQTSQPRPDDTQPGSPGLSVEERRQLLAWIDAASASGIDATEDLRLRPWPVQIMANVIGVFREGEGMAAWLVVGQNGSWTVVAVAEGRVLATEASLAAALSIIHPMPAQNTPGESHDRSRFRVE
jgi:hypothetical protein